MNKYTDILEILTRCNNGDVTCADAAQIIYSRLAELKGQNERFRFELSKLLGGNEPGPDKQSTYQEVLNSLLAAGNSLAYARDMGRFLPIFGKELVDICDVVTELAGRLMEVASNTSKP